MNQPDERWMKKAEEVMRKVRSSIRTGFDEYLVARALQEAFEAGQRRQGGRMTLEERAYDIGWHSSVWGCAETERQALDHLSAVRREAREEAVKAIRLLDKEGGK